jgi:hypothetical protein
VKLDPLFAELLGPGAAPSSPPPIIEPWRILAMAAIIGAIVLWEFFLLQPARADGLAFNLVAHVCQGETCSDHVEPMAGFFACQARARAIEELTPDAWSAKVECIVVRGMAGA